jgi:hypothetical protein
MERTVTLDEIGERSASDLLREVADADDTWHVILEGRGTIDLEPKGLRPSIGESVPPLKPLTVLPGSVPAGWKDAIYDFSDTDS